MAPRRRIPILLVGALAALALASVTLASLSLAKAGGARARTAKGPEPIVGLIDGTSNWGDQTMGRRMSQVASRSGAKWLGERFDWDKIEPQPGVFNFAHYDHFMLVAARKHEHVMGILYSAPSWASPASNVIPTDPSAYADYVAAVARRYGPGGTFWAAHPTLAGYAITTFDLWHEPYYDVGNGGQYDPGRFARLVKAAVSAGRAANPSAKFLLAAEMQGESVGSRYVWWVDALYQAVPDLNNYFDGVSVHPYGHDIKHRSPAIVGHAYTGYDQMRRIEIIRQQFIHHGAGAKPFWATEVGWPTCRHVSNRCVNTRGQVRSLRTLVRYARTIWSGYVRAVFVYYYNDQRGPRSNPENDYGLTYVNHRAKPALRVFRGYARKASATSGW